MKHFPLIFFALCSCALAQSQPRPASGGGVVNGQRLLDDDGILFFDAGEHSLYGFDGNSPPGAVKLIEILPLGGIEVYSVTGQVLFRDVGGELDLLDDSIRLFSDGSASFAGGAATIDVSGNITGNGSALSGLGFSQIGSTPTTLSGYGITDAQPKATTAQLLAQTAAIASVTVVTAPDDAANHLYTCGGTITVTAISANTITLQVTYTDETNASRTQSFFGEGLTVAAVSTTGGFTFPPLTIWAKANTVVTIKTTVTGVGSETYDVAGWIQKLD